MLVLTKKMLGADPATFFSIMITGRRSIGKTSYSLHAIKDFFVERGATENNGWRLALDSLKFGIPEVIDFLKDARTNNIKKPVLLWDDVRVHAAGNQYQLNMKRVAKLASLMDVVRTCVSNVILTCPSSSGLLGLLKSYDDYFAKVHHTEKGGYNRVAYGYLWSTIPSGKRLVYSKYKDSFSCYLPQWVYDKYTFSRNKAVDSLIKEVEDLEEKNEQQKSKY